APWTGERDPPTMPGDARRPGGRAEGRMRTPCVALAFVLGIAWPHAPAAADDEPIEKVMEMVLESIEHGEPALAAELLNDSIREKLVASPKTVYRACKVAYKHVGSMSKRGLDPTDRLALWLYD